ncbi:MAG: CoA ester lyase [Armatimonadota bacterium]|nr:CoA ester lyase [Armatimonadota bacterium]MDR7448907.1 CoA ester lyase [Armatimonadota bacterium]MDR7460161.1 CoA ester lyase [Armatimonadota bacterium]MDR7479213.1 CoA ester lyase [Armatimonadota bacterium]MDR7487875.1 CoA ester lyase [Armatimonadota bacterium]
MGPSRPLRSMLFVPGDQPRMLARARQVSADAVILDLEDAVAAADKPRARALVAQALAEGFPASTAVCVRPNSRGTGLLEEDLRAVLHPALWGVVVPKVADAAEVVALDEWLTAHEPAAGLDPGTVRLLVLIETPRAVLDAVAIAQATPRVTALLLGADDLAAAMGIRRTPTNAEVAYPRAHVAVAAHAGGVEAIDMVYTAVRDTDGFRAEAEAGRLLGYTGKQCIHPTQVEVANAVFTPSPEEVAWAMRVVEAYATAPRGTIVLDGRMVDAPIVAQAQRLLERARGAAVPPERPTRRRSRS